MSSRIETAVRMIAFAFLLIVSEVLAAEPTAPAPEPILAPELVGLGFFASEKNAAGSRTVERGLYVQGVEQLDNAFFGDVVKFLLGQPVTRTSLELVQSSTRIYLASAGYPFSVVYAPEQDITDGYVRFVVLVSRLSDEVDVSGAHYFNAELYRDAITQRSGQAIDGGRLRRDVAWLNRNPYRHVRAMASPGDEPGTTRIVLNVQERPPWRFFAGANNSGTKTTKEERVVAGFDWGNALGAGHRLSLQFAADPGFSHSRSLSGTYAFDTDSRNTVTLAGTLSKTDAITVAPFDLTGRSYQLSADYEMPAEADSENASTSYVFGFDYKVSNNNFEFAQTPITHSDTDVIQARAGYHHQQAWRGGMAQYSATLKYSPGGLSGGNSDDRFSESRGGATADYSTLSVSGSNQMPLGDAGKFAWVIRGNAQLADSNLLGSEQIGAGGASSVRGYEEGAVYMDNGIVLSNELQFPAFTEGPGGGQFRFALFHDFAHLSQHDELPLERAVNLRSVGVSANYSIGSVNMSLSYGHQLGDSVGASNDRSRVHFTLMFSR